MEVELFKNFDFNLLESPDFKEDSVREEIIAPILNKLGYSASSDNKIIRSKNLTHPFVHIGTKAHKVNIIPDYLLLKDNKYIFALDAKAPNENIFSGKNVEQAYSYAIHPEVRVFFYGLCNGRDFVVFQITKLEPIISIPLRELDTRWDELFRAISPIALTNPDLLDFMPDLGLSLMKVNANTQIDYLFPGTYVQTVSKLDENNYTLNTAQGRPGEEYMVTMDFSKDLFDQFISCVPDVLQESMKHGLTHYPFFVSLTERAMFGITIAAKLSGNVISNPNEEYCPFIVESFEAVPKDLQF
jgi:hypothetical protein